MNWVTFIWAGAIAACATMALPHLLVGLKERAPQNLFFVFTALFVAGIATGELAMMHARTIADIGRAHQLTYIPLFLLNISIAGLTTPRENFLTAEFCSRRPEGEPQHSG